MRTYFTPTFVIKKRRLQFLAGLLILSLISSVTYYLTLPSVSSATYTYVWDDVADFNSGVTDGTVVDSFEDSIRLPFKNTFSEDSTAEEFLESDLFLNDFFYTAVQNLVDGEVVLNQGWKYNPQTSPAVGSYVYTSLVDGDLLYALAGSESVSGGVTVIDTSGTKNPSDDTLLGTYTDATNPALLSATVYQMFIADQLLYFTTSGGLSVIDTKGTKTLADDTAVGRYNTASAPVIPADPANSFNLSFLDPANDILYVCATNGGITAIDTKGTATSTDDTVLITYNANSAPARTFTDNDATWGHFDEESGALFFLDSNQGITVIDTKKTATTSDDTSYAYRLEGVYETTVGSTTNTLLSSTPKITNSSSDTYAASWGFYDNENTVMYVSGNDGVMYIDMNNTVFDPTDDRTYVYRENGVYDITNSISGTIISSLQIGGSSFSDFFLFPYHIYYDEESGHFYYGQSSGVYIVDTNHTRSPEDDTLLNVYDNETSPQAPEGFITDIKKFDNLLHISTVSKGLVVIDLDQEYSSVGTYTSAPMIISTTSTTSISLDKIQSLDHLVTVQYRTGGTDAVWFNDFDDGLTTEYGGGWINPGDEFQTAVESEGTMKLSNPLDLSASFSWILTDKPFGYFPASSRISVRNRINVGDYINNARLLLTMSDFDFENAAFDFIMDDNWVTSYTIAGAPFSTIGSAFIWTPYVWQVEDNHEIDWIRIITPDSFGQWNAWSAPCSDSECLIDSGELVVNDWIQYRLNLSTTNLNTSPSVHSVTISNGYESAGTYTSPTESFPRSNTLLTFDADVETPTSTDVVFTYSIDDGDTWQNINPGESFPEDTKTKSFIWRAVLTTSDSLFSPVINSVNISTVVDSKSQSTSLRTQIEKLEKQGKMEKAEELREKYNGLNEQEVQKEIIGILEKTIYIIKRIRELEKEGR